MYFHIFIFIPLMIQCTCHTYRNSMQNLYKMVHCDQHLRIQYDLAQDPVYSEHYFIVKLT